MSNIYGYVRVSTKEQNEERQILAMKQMDIPLKNIFIDKQSGKDFDRPQYKKMLKKIKPKDTIFVKSIDRLGRNYNEILEQWRFITKEKGVDLVVIDMPLLDTRNKDNDLTGMFISDLVLQILSYVAQTEREFIKKRQAEGIAAAKARGVRFGPQAKPLPENFYKAKTLWENGTMSVRQAAKAVNMPHSTFYKHCRKLQTTSECNKDVY